MLANLALRAVCIREGTKAPFVFEAEKEKIREIPKRSLKKPTFNSKDLPPMGEPTLFENPHRPPPPLPVGIIPFLTLYSASFLSLHFRGTVFPALEQRLPSLSSCPPLGRLAT